MKYDCIGTVKHLPLTRLPPDLLSWLSLLLRFSLTLFSANLWLTYFHFSHIPACFFAVTFSPLFCFLAYLTVACHGDTAAESVFASHLFCCSTSVKSEADVHLIKYNTLIINSCLHRLRHIDRALAQQVAYFALDFRKPSHSSQWKILIINLCWRQRGEEVAEILRSA